MRNRSAGNRQSPSPNRPQHQRRHQNQDPVDRNENDENVTNPQIFWPKMTRDTKQPLNAQTDQKLDQSENDPALGFASHRKAPVVVAILVCPMEMQQKVKTTKKYERVEK